MANILRRNFILLLIILMVAFPLIFPGVILAEDNSNQVSNNTITIEAPEQAITGQTLTLIAQVRENEYDEPVEGRSVIFFVKTDFYIKGLVEIGEAVTDNHGLAKIDYIPNQPGDLQVVASYKADSNSKPVIAESIIIVSGETKPIYQTVIGIQFPNSFIIWLIIIIVIICIVWGIFLFVIYKVMVVHISRGTGAKGASLALFIVVAVLFIIILLVFATPEPQYNFGLLPP